MSKILTLIPVAIVTLSFAALFSLITIPLPNPVHIQCQPGAQPPYALTCQPPANPFE